MNHDFSDRGVRVKVDADWTARPANARAVVAHPRELSGLAPEYLPISVYIEMHPASEGLEPAASGIMRRRAYAGALDAKGLEIHGSDEQASKHQSAPPFTSPGGSAYRSNTSPVAETKPRAPTDLLRFHPHEQP